MVKSADTAVCPICGKPYKGYPAISRKDNKTPICPECGTKEALDSYFEYLEYRGIPNR